MPQIEIRDLGRIEYEPARQVQERLAELIALGEQGPTLLLLEHPHAYTFGRTGNRDHLLLDAEQLKERGIAVHWSDRGGDVTYHGPGQLVGYPLVPLKPIAATRNLHDGLQDEQSRVPRADYVGFVRRLEVTLIRALASLGIAAGQRPGLTGVWVQADVWSRCARCRPEDRRKPAKLAAIGVKVDARGVTRHGFALNVDPDMSYWQGIVPCGLHDGAVAALSDLLDPPPSMDQVKAAVTDAFSQVFDLQLTVGKAEFNTPFAL
jgi:lipoate-protein ligase B